MFWDLEGSAIKAVRLLLGSLTLGTLICGTQPPYLNFRLNQAQNPQKARLLTSHRQQLTSLRANEPSDDSSPQPLGPLADVPDMVEQKPKSPKLPSLNV